MNIFVTGSSSILGSAIMEVFFQEGHTIYTYNRIPAEGADVSSLISQLTNNSDIDIVLLLQAGDIYRSDLSNDNQAIARAGLQKLNAAIYQYFSEKRNKPKLILSSSSLAIYDTTGDAPIVETTSLGSDNISLYYQDLEGRGSIAAEAGIRVVHMRLGEIVSRSFAPSLITLPFFNLAASSFMDVNQSISWISREDSVRALRLIMKNSEIDGPVNITSGDTPKRTDFIKIITNYFGIKRSIPLPLTVNRLLLGEELAALLAMGIKAVPFRLMEEGFFFEDISLQDYLQR